MAQPLRKLARYFKRNFEVRFNPLFAETVECGAIVDVDGWDDVDYVTITFTQASGTATATASFGVLVEYLMRGNAGP